MYMTQAIVNWSDAFYHCFVFRTEPEDIRFCKIVVHDLN